MIAYDMPLWRPPSEARSLILQATVGCSFNRCSFCSMYRTKEFRIRPLGELFREIDAIAASGVLVRRVFLADGDALVCPTDHLLQILERLGAALPDLQRVSTYALPVNLLRKSEDELTTLREHRLSLLFYGMESGSRDIQRRITKGATPEVMIEGLEKARAAGMKVSATVILGLGGRRRWREHIDGTVELVSRVPPNYLSTLQLGLEDIVEDEFRHKFREPFEWQDDAGMLEELEVLVAGIDPPRPIIFRSNHASNALALAGNLPKDRDRLLREIAAARHAGTNLRPPWVRGY